MHKIPLILLAVVFMGVSVYGESQVDWTRTPMRPLPTASDRALPTNGTNYFVDAAKGKDDAAGTEQAPVKTIAAGLKKLKPGDTLVLRAGTYYEPITCGVSGEQGKPITLRAYPKELVTVDAGLREFMDDPAKAWEPVEGGAPGEFRSTHTYPNLPEAHEQAVGNFAESMVPLHPYRSGIDLRTDNQFWIFTNKTDTAEGGLYCGPGIWFDDEGASASHRMYIRLTHLNIPGLKERNYANETDPRKLKLVVAGNANALAINGQHDVRVQDLVFRGSRGPTILMADDKNIQFDGVTVFSGSTGMLMDRCADVQVSNTAFRGLAAPWSFRNHMKYRGVDSYIVMTSSHYAGDPTNERISFDNCEFTDHHDALRLDGCKSVAVRHCLMDNFNDDGIDFGPKHETQRFEIVENVLSRTFQVLTVHRDEKGAGPLVNSTSGSGAYIARNVIDERGAVLARLPASKDAPDELPDFGRPLIDHGSPTWVPLFIYQNTVLLKAPVFRDYYAGGMITGLRGTERRILNNIFVHATDMPGHSIPIPEEGGDFVGDYNLHWSLAKGPGYSGDYLAEGRKAKNPKLDWFAASKKTYPVGWTTHDLFADPKLTAITPDWSDPTNISLQNGSPAIDKGGPIPAEWPDPLRSDEKGAPDLGALPAGAKPWTFGVHGRYSTAKLGMHLE